MKNFLGQFLLTRPGRFIWHRIGKLNTWLWHLHVKAIRRNRLKRRSLKT